MQDEVNTKVVAIMIKGGKISAEVLKKALDKFVQEIEKAQKQMQQPKTYRGKQSIKHLMSQNAAISNIEVTDGNIKSFERTASKYGLDFALKKDVSVEPPSYLVFFKGRDVDVMTAAFKEFSAKTVKQKEQPSIRHKLDQEKAQSTVILYFGIHFIWSHGKRHYSSDENSSPSILRTSSIGILVPSRMVIRRSKSSIFLTAPTADTNFPPAFRSSGWK